MRVAQVVCSDGFAGVERYVGALATELSGLGVETTVVGGRRDAMAAALKGTSVDWAPGDTMAQAAASLARLRVDLVNAHMTEAELVATGLGALRRTPVVSTRHFAGRRGSGVSARAVGAWIQRRLAGQVAISHHVAATIGTPSTVIHSGVAPAPATTPPAQSREKAVLVAQRLEPEKETRLALEAWARTQIRRQGWRLWVAGGGSLAHALRAQADRLGIADEVDFLGRRDDLPMLYDRAALLLAPTPIEGFGLSVAEAMAHGLPVVASAAAGHLETVGAADPRWLFPPGDAAAAATLVDRLAEDAGLREDVGARLQQSQREHFTLRRQAEETLAYYRTVLAR